MRLYWTTEEVALLLDEPAYTIKAWRRKFGLRVRGLGTCKYRYTKANVETLARIKWLIRVKKYTTEGAKIHL